MPSSSPSLTRGYSIALLSAVILSTTAIFIRHLTQTYQLPALVLAFWRDGIVSLTLLLVLRLLHPALLQVGRRNLAYLFIYGFLLSIFNSLWTLAVALIGASLSTVLVYCSAAFTALLGWLFLKERLDWAKIVAVILSLGGCVLVAGALDPAAWQAGTLGIACGVLSGLAYAVYSLMGRSASQRGLNPWTTVVYTFGFATMFLLLYNLLFGGLLPGTAPRPADLFWLGSSLAGWGVLIALANGPTLIGFGLYNTSLSLLPSSVANLIVTLEPVFTAVIAYFLLGERMTPVQMGGSLMIIGAVFFLRIYDGWVASRTLAAGVVNAD